PAKSPDLNPIEYLWNDASNNIIRERDALWEYVSQVWNKTALETCTKLIETLPERIQDIINAKGGYTRW
ncbi:transposable element Tcb1 transposase, partial [Rhizophagus irregularis]